MAKIVVIGSINTDMVIRAPHIPIPGQTMLGQTFLIHSGGKGANQAVAAARLGCDVALVAKIGNDAFGQQALDSFKKENINIKYISKDHDEPTGVAMITVDDDGENTIVVALGANSKLSGSDIIAAETEIEKADAVLFQLESPIETIYEAMKLAKKYNKLIILNPAPTQALDNKLLTLVDILALNQIESLFLTDLIVEDTSNAIQAADILHEKGVKTVVVMMGEQGSYISSADYKGMVPTKEVQPVDSTSASDTFSGALAVALVEGKNIEEAVKFANIAAALSIMKHGTQSSIPYRWEVEEHI